MWSQSFLQVLDRENSLAAEPDGIRCDCHSRHEQDQAQPLPCIQNSSQQNHTEHRSRQDLELTRDLERRSIQVPCRNVLQTVLHGIQHRRYRHLPAISGEHRARQLFKYAHDGGSLSRLRTRHDFVQSQCERDRKLQDFVQEDRGGCMVALAIYRRHCLGVVHYEDEGGVLEGELIGSVSTILERRIGFHGFQRTAMSDAILLRVLPVLEDRRAMFAPIFLKPENT